MENWALPLVLRERHPLDVTNKEEQKVLLRAGGHKGVGDAVLEFVVIPHPRQNHLHIFAAAVELR
jgi:hypothetical protein